MKGNKASTQSTTEFVIVTGTAPFVAAWMSPRGKAVKASCNRWTKDASQAHVYQGWERASKAIDRMVKGGWVNPGQAQYCTFGEFIRLQAGEEL